MRAKNIVVRFFNLTYMGHWWIMVITAIIGLPMIVDPGKDIMIVNLFFTWVLGPIIMINFFLMTFKFLKDVFTD